MTAGTIDSLRNYLSLAKPGVLALVVVSGVPPLMMAARGSVSAALAAATLGGIALAAAAANALNCYVERERDAWMERTRSRPLPAARLRPGRALAFGLALAAVGTGVLWTAAGVVPASLAVASILFYVFVYTVWAKPRSSWNAVIGGAAGASAPLIADSAVNGSVGVAGWWLFALIFLWQLPHVWAIVLYRKADYAHAGIPTPPSVIGEEATRRLMLVCTLALIPVTIAPVLLGLLGGLYLGAALALDGWFVWHVVRLLREQTELAARRAFRVSLVYLFALLFATLLDVALR